MSSPDFDPTMLAALVEGARRTACCDEAELRTHQLRNERAGRILRGTEQRQSEPLVSNAAFLFFLTLGLAIAAGLVMYWAMGGAL